MTENGRSDRLRKRRKQSKEKAESVGTSESSEPSKPSKPSEESETDETDETSEDSKPSESVKTELQGTYMYLTEDLVAQLDKEFKRLDFELDDQLEHDLEKNRDFYNLIVGVGLEEVRELDADTLAERVQSRRQ